MRLPSAFVLALLLPSTPMAQPIEEVALEVGDLTNGISVEGTLEGRQVVDYLLPGIATDTLAVSMEATNPSIYFNVLEEEGPEALHTGSIDGNAFSGAVEAGQDYRVRVHLMRNAARRGETAAYSLDVATGGADARPPDFADGLSGGPDTWQVDGVSTALNIRGGPSSSAPVVAQVGNGARLTNRGGCVMEGETRWCEVETEEEQVGYAAGAFLIEAVASPDATGLVNCAANTGQPMGTCPFRVTRGVPGTASLWITLPDGSERHVEFRDGAPVASDGGPVPEVEQIGDLYDLRIGEERYGFPAAAIYGG